MIHVRGDVIHVRGDVPPHYAINTYVVCDELMIHVVRVSIHVRGV